MLFVQRENYPQLTPTTCVMFYLNEMQFCYTMDYTDRKWLKLDRYLKLVCLLGGILYVYYIH